MFNFYTYIVHCSILKIKIKKITKTGIFLKDLYIIHYLLKQVLRNSVCMVIVSQLINILSYRWMEVNSIMSKENKKYQPECINNNNEISNSKKLVELLKKAQ